RPLLDGFAEVVEVDGLVVVAVIELYARAGTGVRRVYLADVVAPFLSGLIHGARCTASAPLLPVIVSLSPATRWYASPGVSRLEYSWVYGEKRLGRHTAP